jgi:hypothetical protein
MIAFLVANENHLHMQVSLGLLRAAHRDRREVLPELGLLPLHEHSARMLAARLAAPDRPPVHTGAGKDSCSIRARRGRTPTLGG